jgi:phage terminase small subunit
MPSNPPLLPAEVMEPAEHDEGPLLLDPEERKRLLGKLAEFEIAVLALAPAQQAFVFAVLSDPTNLTAAARKAGYKGTSTGVRAQKLINQPKIAAAIALGQNLREDRTFISSDRTLHELAIIAFSNIGDYEVGPGGHVKVREGVPEYALRAVSSMDYTVIEEETEKGVKITYKTKIKLWSKPEALRMLSMYQKLLSGEGGINLTLNQDNRGQQHTHNYQHNEWHWGDRQIKF